MQFSWGNKATMTTDFKLPTTYVVEYSSGEQIDILTDTGGGSGGDLGGDNSGGGGGGGGDGDGDSNESGGASDEGKDHNAGKGEKKTSMSMSQKLTLGYALLVGADGVVMGYLKSGSQKSLFAGGLSASLLYVVYTLLPTQIVIASALGFGLSASLLGVIPSWYRLSGVWL